jgi:peptidoglycan hydrolase-like protein with peptidoglycan-binding domain
MKKLGLIILVVMLSGFLASCGKKQPALEEMQEPMSAETLPMGSIEVVEPAAEAPKTNFQPASAPVVEQKVTEPLPPQGPYKPTAKEIQTALKNANFYMGEVDGKVGPKTKKAIEEFQKANNLQADGKVGPKTWAALSKYLNAAETKQ